MTENPLKELLTAGFPEYDFGVLQHGFAPHGRDYVFVVQDCISARPGTYELVFTHVVDLSYKTRVRPEVWRVSWGDEFTSYERWLAVGEPDGYVFGNDWSLAWPGFSLVEDEEASTWSAKLERPIHTASLATDRFQITLTFSEVRLRKLSSDTATVRQALTPLRSCRGS